MSKIHLFPALKSQEEIDQEGLSRASRMVRSAFEAVGGPQIVHILKSPFMALKR